MTSDMTVVIFAKDAAARVAETTKALRGQVRRVVVADLGSTDGTGGAAARHGAEVIRYDTAPTHVELVRGEVLDRVDDTWILFLDDDEVPDRNLIRELDAIMTEDRVDVVYISTLDYFFGEPVRAAGWQPENLSFARFFRRGSLMFDTKVHSPIAPVKGARKMRLAPDRGLLHHFSYESVSHFLQKLDRYTTVEGQQLAANVFGNRRATLKWWFYALAEPFSLSLRHKGLWGGWRARSLIAMMVAYRAASWAKSKEIHEGYGAERARAKYRELTARLLSGDEQ